MFFYSRQKLIFLFFLSLFLISGLLGTIIDVVRFIKQIPNVSEVPGKKFLPLKNLVSSESEVGFVTQQAGQAYVQDFYQAQNVLAPIIVREGTEPDFIIAANYDPVSIENLRISLGAEVFAKFDHKVYLLKK